MPATRCGTDLMHAIYLRRSVRSFSQHPVGAGAIRMLLDAAAQAPSAGDLRPWAFLVVQDRALLDRLSARATALAPDASERLGRDVFRGAGTLIVVHAERGHERAIVDGALAAQNLMLAAHGHGLGTCVIEDALPALEAADTRRELGLPDGFVAILPIAVGSPLDVPQGPPREEPTILGWR
jgi:nitroreductase